jgi:hypothetical protein
MGGKGQRRRNDTNKMGHVGKKNKTNNNDAVNSMNATTDDADAGTNNAVGLTSEKRRVDADRTKVMVDNTINATTNNGMPTQTTHLGQHQENKGLMLMEPKSSQTTPSGVVQAWVGHWITSLTLPLRLKKRRVFTFTSAFLRSTNVGIVCDPSIEFIINRP